jgi:hypothetical protein
MTVAAGFDSLETIQDKLDLGQDRADAFRKYADVESARAAALLACDWYALDLLDGAE